MAIGARGEGIVEAEGQTYPVLFTNRALAQAEKALGKPLTGFLAVIMRNELGVGDTAQLLAIGIEFGRRDAKTGGKAYTLDDAYRIMDAVGFTAVAAVIMEAIAAVLVYSQEPANPPE